jgi:hypothetical protein
MAFLPLAQQRYLALSTAEVMAEYPIRTVIQLSWQKRSRYIKTSPNRIFVPLKQV